MHSEVTESFLQEKCKANSHLVTGHYMELLNIAVSVDTRPSKPSVKSNNSSATAHLQCDSCEQRQGRLEEKIKQTLKVEDKILYTATYRSFLSLIHTTKEQYYVLRHLSAHAVMPDTTTQIYHNTHVNLYTFLLPNLFRLVFFHCLCPSSPFAMIIWQIFDRLRVTLHRLLNFYEKPESAKLLTSPPLYIYALPIGINTWAECAELSVKCGQVQDSCFPFSWAPGDVQPARCSSLLMQFDPFILCCSLREEQCLASYLIKPPWDLR
jgi:hypothetical protein